MRSQTKYIILFSIYIFVVLYLLLQYLNGSRLASIEKLSTSSNKKVKKLVHEISNELSKEYYLSKKVKMLKEEVKKLKELHQKEISKLKEQISPNQVQLQTNSNIEDEDKPHIVKPISNKDGDEKYVDVDQDVNTLANQEGVIPIIVFTYERAEYLKKCLNTLFKYLPNEGFVIYVSQDGYHEGVSNLVKTYTNRVIHLQVILFF